MVTTFHPSRSVSPYGSAPNTVHEYGDNDDGPYKWTCAPNTSLPCSKLGGEGEVANFHISGSNPKQLEGAISWQIKALQALMTSGSRSLELKRSNFRIDNRNVRFMKAGQA